jgi:IS30 family transposase
LRPRNAEGAPAADLAYSLRRSWRQPTPIREQNHSIAEIAEALGVHRATLFRQIRPDEELVR